MLQVADPNEYRRFVIPNSLSKICERNFSSDRILQIEDNEIGYVFEPPILTFRRHPILRFSRIRAKLMDERLTSPIVEICKKMPSMSTNLLRIHHH